METNEKKTLRKAMLEAVQNRIAHDDFNLPQELEDMLAPLGLAIADSGGKVTFTHRDPLMPSCIRLGGVSALALTQQSVVAAAIWRSRTGLGQNIHCDLGQAIRRLAPSTEMKWETINGFPGDIADRAIMAYLNFYPTKDGRHVIPANLYPGIKSRMLVALDCADDPKSLGNAIAQRTADELETLGETGDFVMAKVRTVEEFVQTEVFDYLAERPLIEIERIFDSAPEPLPEFGTAPLSGIRALGMGHMIAGAGIGRSLGALGADCLNVWRLMDWEQDPLVLTANVGVRSTRLNAKSEQGQAQLHELIGEADIFYANRHPGLLEKLGMDLPTLAKTRPGIIHVTVSTHGEGGPWKNRLGFDQVAGAVCGMVVAEGSLEAPKLPPTLLINDYLVAWLAATGAMTALLRRSKEGGSYRVHVSLTRAAMWAMSLGLFDPAYVKATVGIGGEHELIDPQLFTSLTPLGIYQGVTENVTLSRTPHHYANVLSPRGADQPIWLPKPKLVQVRELVALLRG